MPRLQLLHSFLMLVLIGLAVWTVQLAEQSRRTCNNDDQRVCWPWVETTCLVNHTYYKTDLPQGCMLQIVCNGTNYNRFIPFLDASVEYRFCLEKEPFYQWFYLAADFSSIKLPSQYQDLVGWTEFYEVMAILFLYVMCVALICTISENKNVTSVSNLQSVRIVVENVQRN